VVREAPLLEATAWLEFYRTHWEGSPGGIRRGCPMILDAPPQAHTLGLDRIIRAPRRRVWATWTNPDLLPRWSCPEGMHIPKPRWTSGWGAHGRS
jgi:hypothetical protein